MNPPIAHDAATDEAIARGAQVVFNLSGGKDSTAAMFAATAYLDAIGHSRERRTAIHADLGRVEWEQTAATVEMLASRAGVPLLIVRRPAGDLLDRWRGRFERAKLRYAALETYQLIGPWSSASLRFCTSEHKANVIGPALARRFAGATIINVIGIRRAESTSRRTAPVAKPDTRFARPGNVAGTAMLIWHPIVDWSDDEVFAYHANNAVTLHEAYTRFGSPRLSCRFCVLASIAGLDASTRAASNHEHYRDLVALEASSTFSFQPARWLADVAPRLLSPALTRDVARAKADAATRRELETRLPPDLRFVKGWPPRSPTLCEAAIIAATRARLLDRHGLPDRFPSPMMVQRRFDELLAAKVA